MMLSTHADPSNMQDACHTNFIIDLAHRRVCDSVVEHRSAAFEGLRFDSSWGLRFFLCLTLVTRRKTPFPDNHKFHSKLVPSPLGYVSVEFHICLYNEVHGKKYQKS